MEFCSKVCSVLPQDGRNTSKDVSSNRRRSRFRMDLCEECCFTVTMTPTMNSAKATLNSSVWSSPHLARNVGKMLSNVAMMVSGLRVEVVDYGDGKVVGALNNWNF